MSEVGYYRYKIKAAANQQVLFIQDSEVAGIKSVVVIDDCSRTRMLKYLDKNGQYRFYPFESFAKKFDVPRKIGSANKFLTNILNDMSDSSNIGYRNNQLLLLNATVTATELEKLMDIYTSPRVYLYTGDFTTDLVSDYLEVEIESSDNIVDFGKQKAGLINLTIKLPTNYTVTML